MLVAFSVTPLGTGTDVGELVAEAVRVVRASGLPNRTDAMFTTIEGEWDEVMAVVKEATDAVAARAPRVSLVVKADLRPGTTGALEAKVETIERHLAALTPAPGVRHPAWGTRHPVPGVRWPRAVSRRGASPRSPRRWAGTGTTAPRPASRTA